MAQNLSMEAAIGTLLRLKRASGWRVPLAKSGPIGATVGRGEYMEGACAGRGEVVMTQV